MHMWANAVDGRRLAYTTFQGYSNLEMTSILGQADWAVTLLAPCLYHQDWTLKFLLTHLTRLGSRKSFIGSILTIGCKQHDPDATGSNHGNRHVAMPHTPHQPGQSMADIKVHFDIVLSMPIIIAAVDLRM